MSRLLVFDTNLHYLVRDADYPVGGATVQLLAWIKGLTAVKQQVGVLTHKGSTAEIHHRLDFDFIETYCPDVGIPKLRWLYYRYPRLWGAIKRYSPDYIYYCLPGTTTGILAHIARRLRIPFFFRMSNDYYSDNRYQEKFPQYTRLSYEYGLKSAQGIICQNRYQHDCLKDKYPKKKMTIIHNPYYPSGNSTRHVSFDRRQYVAWLGVFQHQKNLPGLLEIVKQLPDVKFKIAGKPLPTIDRYTEIAIQRLQGCENAEFIGYLKRSEIAHFLSNAYTLLNTSHYEGFSNTYLESFAAGTPVVTTINVDPDDIIKQNNLGLVAETFRELPVMLRKLLTGNNYEQISLNCKLYVEKYHDPKEAAKRLLDFIEH